MGSMRSLDERILALGVLLVALVWPGAVGGVSPKALVEVVDFGPPTVSPDGKMLAFRTEQASVERNVHHTAWYVQRLDGNHPPRRVSEGGLVLRDSAGVPLPASAIWSPDGRWIYYIARFDDKTAVWRASSDGRRAEAVTRDAADVRDFMLSPDGRTVDYRVKATREQVRLAEMEEYDSGIHMDETMPVGQSLFRSGLVEGAPATQRLGFWFDRVSLLEEVPDRWKSIDVGTWEVNGEAAAETRLPGSSTVDESDRSTGVWKSVMDAGTGRVALLKRTRDPNLIAARDVQLWLQQGPGSRKRKRCSHEPCTGRNITSIQWRPGSDDLLFTITDPDEGWAQSIYRWDIASDQVFRVARSRGLINGGRSEGSACGVSHVEMICIVAEVDQPPRLERIEIDSGRRRIAFDPNADLRAELAAAPPAQLIRWNDASGQSFTGQFFPAHSVDGATSPLFVSYYKCPGFLRGGHGDEWPLATLAFRGISALCINAMPYQKDAVKRYESGLSAVASVVKNLANQGRIDPKKIGMGGLSFGTEVTFWAVMHSDLVTAASVSSLSISRQYELLGSLKGESFYEGLHEYWQLEKALTEERWALVSPASNLDRIVAPILMQLPEQEYIHTLDYSIPLMRQKKADIYIFPHEPHQKFQPRHKLAVYERNVDWFLFWLKGFVDPEPLKRKQYEKWHAMRDSGRN